MKVTVWNNCYDKPLRGYIRDESFAHPAKYSLALIERIYDHCLAQGYLKKNDLVGDVFGGVAIGGIAAGYRGLRWIGCELESRFVNFGKANINFHLRKLEYLGLPVPELVQGDSRRFHELIQVHGVVSSPPYSEIAQSGGSAGLKKHGTGLTRGERAFDEYGQSEGQIGRLKSGTVEAVISSPPYAETGGNGGGGINVKGYVPAPGRKWTGAKPDNVGARTYQGRANQRDEANIETLKVGSVDGVISSPPYAESTGVPSLGSVNKDNWGKEGTDIVKRRGLTGEYGSDPQQIGRLKGGSVEAVVTSPPFEEQARSTQDRRSAKFKDDASFKCGKSTFEDYGETPGQIGQEKGESYWEAMNQVYRSCYQAIKPNGVLVLVLKDYVQKGKRIPLCDDTAKLLEHIGFVPLERIHALLVKETRHGDLFTGESVKKTERKSFFRRLAEKKGSPRIDEEQVLIYKRPE